MALCGRLFQIGLLALVFALAFCFTPAFADDGSSQEVGLVSHVTSTPATADRFTGDFSRLSAGQPVDLLYPGSRPPSGAVVELPSTSYLHPVSLPAPPPDTAPQFLQGMKGTRDPLRRRQQKLQPRITIGKTTIWIEPILPTWRH